jgi:hypothetical protein
MQACRWRDGGLPDQDGRLALYVGETRGVYDVAGDPTDTPRPKFMLVAGPYGSDACARAVDWDCCIIGEGA